MRIDSDISTTKYFLYRSGKSNPDKWDEVETPTVPTNYERFITGMRTGKQELPDFARGAEIQKLLDTCFVSDKKSAPVKL